MLYEYSYVRNGKILPTNFAKQKWNHTVDDSIIKYYVSVII